MITSTLIDKLKNRCNLAFDLRVIARIFVMGGLLSCVTPVISDELADINKIMQSGQYVEAIAKIEAALIHNPRDAKLRNMKSLAMFMRGLTLTEQGKSSQAITVFTKLTEEFPELPEPYNNLGVLYAASGQYEKSRQAFETAIKTNPSYSTALENLGDVYAKLASHAYDKALQLDTKNSDAQSKLTLIRTLMSNPNTKPVVPATTVPLATTPVEKSAPVTQQPEIVKPDVDEVMGVVYGWAKAWSSRDVKAYLGSYADNFELPAGVSRAAWVEDRRIKIESKRHIEVKIDSPRAVVKDGRATVRFQQIYRSDRFNSRDWKVLELESKSGHWKIRRERASS